MRPVVSSMKQRVGFYRVWHHEYWFRTLRQRGTEVRDLVTYGSSFRPLLNRFIIAPQLEPIFDYPKERLAHGPGQPPA
jgi:hypothetical protein